MNIGRRGFISGSALLGASAITAGCSTAKGVSAKDAGACDVFVAGGGPAGIAAAIGAARAGAKVQLVESEWSLGGVWTTGLVPGVLRFGSCDLDREISERLERYHARVERWPGRESARYTNYLFEPEYMKLVLSELLSEAGVSYRLGTFVTAAETSGGEISAAVTESASGRERWRARTFVDCTGDGTLAARAGCGYDLGDGAGGPGQPASLLALVTIPDDRGILEFVANDPSNIDEKGRAVSLDVKHRLTRELRRIGIDNSYAAASLMRLSGNVFIFGGSHEYGVNLEDADSITAATERSRREILTVLDGLVAKGGERWKGLRVVATGERLAHRDARRIHGRYTLTVEDAINGSRFEDAVARASSSVDVHATSRAANDVRPEGAPGPTRYKPFDIPLRACRAKDLENVYMAGRCISGDFITHASYRMTGTAVATGFAVGRHVGAS